jgi:hypothetical protein
VKKALVKIKNATLFAGMVIACALFSYPVSAQRVPSCSDEDIKQNMTGLVSRWLQNQLDVGWDTEVQTGVAPPGASKPVVLKIVIMSAIQMPFIGYTPCMIAGQAVTRNNQKSVIVPFDTMLVKVAYNNNGDLVMEMLDGFR